MEKLIILIVIILGAIALAQLIRVYELSSKLRKSGSTQNRGLAVSGVIIGWVSTALAWIFLIGFISLLPALIILQLRLRTTFWIVFAAVAVGVEINEGWANMSGITPPFRIDIHDVALRGLGVLAATLVVQRSRQAFIDRDLRRKRANAPAAAHAASV